MFYICVPAHLVLIGRVVELARQLVLADGGALVRSQFQGNPQLVQVVVSDLQWVLDLAVAQLYSPKSLFAVLFSSFEGLEGLAAGLEVPGLLDVVVYFF